MIHPLNETDYRMLVKRNRHLGWAAVAGAAFYVGAFFLESWWGPPSSGDNIDGMMPGSIRPLILLCMAAAAITIMFLPEFGKILGAFSLIGVIALFIQWVNVTAGIKLNLGVQTIPGSDKLGNFLVGANVVDVFAFVFAIVILTWDVWTVWTNFALRFKKKDSDSLPLSVMRVGGK